MRATFVDILASLELVWFGGARDKPRGHVPFMCHPVFERDRQDLSLKVDNYLKVTRKRRTSADFSLRRILPIFGNKKGPSGPF